VGKPAATAAPRAAPGSGTAPVDEANATRWLGILRCGLLNSRYKTMAITANKTTGKTNVKMAPAGALSDTDAARIMSGTCASCCERIRCHLNLGRDGQAESIPAS
jgi:hypothetical protein